MKTKLTLIAIALLAIVPLANAATFKIVAFDTAVVPGSMAVAFGFNGDVTSTYEGTINDVALGTVYNLAVFTDTAIDGFAAGTVLTGGLSLSATGDSYEMLGTFGPYSKFDQAYTGVGDLSAQLSYLNLGGSAAVNSAFLYGFSVTVNGSGSINFGDLLGDPVTYSTGGQTYTNATTQGIAFNVVPEPITVALMGLGGLFVARKKK